VRALGTATWSFVAWLLVHSPWPAHLHHATRVVHLASAIVRR
jgi:hypothetical protein